MDMKFTAISAVQHRGRARDLRSQFSGVLKEFARCLEPLYEYLKLQAVVYRSKFLDIHVVFVVGATHLIGRMNDGLRERLPSTES